jgi:hypothetical protein
VVIRRGQGLVAELKINVDGRTSEAIRSRESQKKKGEMASPFRPECRDIINLDRTAQ